MSQITNDVNMQELRTKPYAVQMQGVAEAIQGFLSSHRASIALPVTFDNNAVMEWTEKYVEHRYTRAELLEQMVIMHATCGEWGVKAYGKSVPDFAHTASHFVAGLTHTFTVTSGRHKGDVRNLMMHALGSARRSIKQDIKKEAIRENMENGDAWYAGGCVDKKGNLIAYLNEASARGAWVRHKDNFGSEWYVDLSKDERAKLKASADVFPQAKMVGRMTVSGQADNSVNKFTSQVLATMATVTLKRHAKDAGAPESVRVGAGCKARILAWFGEDVKRMQGLNL